MVAVGVQREHADALSVAAEDADLIVAVAVPVANHDLVAGQAENKCRITTVDRAVAVGVENEFADAVDVAEDADVVLTVAVPVADDRHVTGLTEVVDRVARIVDLIVIRVENPRAVAEDADLIRRVRSRYGGRRGRHGWGWRRRGD